MGARPDFGLGALRRCATREIGEMKLHPYVDAGIRILIGIILFLIIFYMVFVS
jgi:hypothetical protein